MNVKNSRFKDVLGGMLVGIIACLILMGCGSDQSNAGTNNSNSGSAFGNGSSSSTDNGSFGGTSTSTSNQNVASSGVVPVAQQPVQAQAAQVNPTGNLEQDVQNVVKTVKPAVVEIVAQIASTNDFGGLFGGGSSGGQQEEGIGTGSIITPDGYILTNNHVVEGATTLTVVLTNGKSYKGQLVGREGNTNDMAIVKINPQNGETFPTISYGDSSQLQVGQQVVAIGNALGLPGGPSATSGIVSAIGRSIQEPNNAQLTDLIQTDAAINPGNSGGPLLNLNGQIVGMNTAAAVDPESGAAANNIGFAISINQLRSLIDAYVKGGPTGGQQVAQGRPFMGILPQAMTAGIAARYGLPIDTGILIARVDPNTPAQKAGWQAGDIIVNMDGTDLVSLDDLSGVLARHKPGDTVNAVLVSVQGQQRQSRITFSAATGS